MYWIALDIYEFVDIQLINDIINYDILEILKNHF